jgi:hypothetical protein
MSVLKKAGLAILVIIGVVVCLVIWAFWYYRPTFEYVR